MTAKLKVIASSGNVFADLGLPGAEDEDTKMDLAVAINAAVVPRSQWSRAICDNDSVEVLTAIQGG